jgi:hypothetical protein
MDEAQNSSSASRSAEDQLGAASAAFAGGDCDEAVERWSQASRIARSSGDHALSRHAQTLIMMHSGSEPMARLAAIEAAKDAVLEDEPADTLNSFAHLINRLIVESPSNWPVSGPTRSKARSLLQAIDADLAN